MIWGDLEEQKDEMERRQRVIMGGEEAEGKEVYREIYGKRRRVQVEAPREKVEGTGHAEGEWVWKDE